MCGIVGIGVFKKNCFSFDDQMVIEQLLIADQVRGTHGTGVFKIHEDGKMESRKIAGNPTDLFRSKDFEKDFWDPIISQWVRWIVGHNRFATTGARSTENAHPFTYEHITLVHNGTISKWGHDLPELSGPNRETNVDSEAICMSIAKRGLEETLSLMSGAWALVYFDQKTKTMNFLRNNERPLFFGICRKEKVVAFSSELNMLRWVLERNKIDDVEYMALPVDELWQFQLDDMEAKKTPMKIERKFKWAYPFESKKSKSEGEYVYDKTTNTYEWVPKVATRGFLPFKEEKPNKKGKKETPQVNPSAPEWAKEDAAKAGKEREFSKHYKPCDALFDLKSKSTVLVNITDFEEIGTKIDSFMLKGESNDYPDVEFRAVVRGRKKLDHMMFGDRLQGNVAWLLRSERFDHPNLIYLAKDSIAPAWIDENTKEVFTCEYTEEEKRA